MPDPEALSREELIALVLAQARLVDQQARTIEAQKRMIARLEARVAELERRLGRNSGNSSMPPSTDDLPGHTPPPEKPQRGKGPKRKPGKQPGAPGANLSWTEDPDDTVPHFPSGRYGCAADLAIAADLGVAYAHQVHDIPEVSATVTQHNRHQVRCGCGAEHVAALRSPS